MKALLKSAGLLVICLVFLLYGFIAHRNQMFPYGLIRAVAANLGLHQSRPDLRSRSRALAALRANPYVSSSIALDPQERSVFVYDTKRAYPGYNFYNSLGRTHAWLIDMEGEILHQWSYPALGGEWHEARLLRDGSILVAVKDRGLIKLDKASKLTWIFETHAHHPLWVDDQGDIYLLSRDAALIPEIHPVNRTTVDKVIVLSPEGRQKEEISVLDLVRQSEFAYLLPSLSRMDFPTGTELDVLHTNYVEVFDGSKGHLSSLYRRGNLLISMRTINAVIIVDGSSRQILWLWGPNNLAEQHYPTLLENGNILIFDNGWEESRVVELNPATRTVEWSYSGEEAFFSAFAGAAQRLPNGNTLITVSSAGEAVEVTPVGETVWGFANPEVDEQDLRTNIYKMTRYSTSQLDYPWK